MSDSTKALYELFPDEDKNDFYHAYIYLKYFEHLMRHIIERLGLPTNERVLEPLDPSIEELIHATAQRYFDTGNDRATSIYHGKVVKLRDAVQLVNQQKDLTLPVSERVVPFKIARDVILRNPEHVAVGTCVCRAASPNPCLPVGQQEVCLYVGDPYASFLAEQNPLFRMGSREEAVHILEDVHKRGFVHCAYFKREMGNRFCAICNCCSCCCMGIQMFHQLGLGDQNPFLAPSGYLSQVGNDCNGCGECLEYCQFKAISLDEETSRAVIDPRNCMGCGVCEDICPIGAVTLERDPSKGEPLDIEELVSKAK